MKAAECEDSVTAAIAPTEIVAAGSPIRIVISDDRMSAELHPHPEHQPAASSISMGEIIQAITAAGLPTPSDNELLQNLGGAELPLPLQSPIVIAQGKPPIDDIPARLDMLLTENTAETKNVISHYDRHHYLTAAVGQPIARIIPKIPGTAGADVFGCVIPHGRSEDQFSLGANVAMDADGATIVSQIAGRVQIEHGKLWVNPMLDIPSDVDFTVGNVDFAGDVHVRGNVLDLFHVNSQGNVIIDGAVEAAEVAAAGSLIVRGGIVGKERGRCSAKKNLTLKYATNATLSADGDIFAQIEIANCRVTCGGVLDINGGVIVGGEAQARGGMKCSTIGSPSGTSTIVEVGTDPQFRQKLLSDIAELKRLHKEIHALHEIADPLLQNRKSLTAAQKQQLTELLFETGETDKKAAELALKLRGSVQAAQSAPKPEILIAKFLYVGVTIRFPELECVVTEALRGPLRLVARKFDTIGMMICAVPHNGGHAVVLPTRQNKDETMQLALAALGIMP